MGAETGFRVAGNWPIGNGNEFGSTIGNENGFCAAITRNRNWHAAGNEISAEFADHHGYPSGFSPAIHAASAAAQH